MTKLRQEILDRIENFKATMQVFLDDGYIVTANIYQGKIELLTSIIEDVPTTTEETRHIVTADCEGLMGTLRYGHKELSLTESELIKFKQLPESEQLSYVDENGEMIIDDFDTDDYELTNITIN